MGCPERCPSEIAALLLQNLDSSAESSKDEAEARQSQRSSVTLRNQKWAWESSVGHAGKWPSQDKQGHMLLTSLLLQSKQF